MRFYRHTAHMGCALLLASILSACVVQPAKPVTAEPAAFALALTATKDGGLSATDMKQVNGLLHAQGRLSNQLLTIVPFNRTGQQLAQRLQSALQTAGAPSVKIERMAAAESQAEAASQGWDIELRSVAIITNTNECTLARPELNQYPLTNSPYYAVGPLGCATRNNIAHMVANPRDILHPQVLDGASGTTTAAAIQRYNEDKIKELIDINFDE